MNWPPRTMPSPLTPIAIVGMSCRMSGDVSTLDDFWTLVTRSRDGWTPVPEDRFSSQAYHHPNPQKKGCFNQKGGYFMRNDFSKFDAPFFQITKEEATAMDPQQRQLIECTYEALENAGLPKDSVAGKQMGVFVGGTSSDYRIGTLRDLDQVPTFDATGNHQSIQAGRLSYLFDLRGPCFAVDTACSSSLYALHLAVQSIRSGESDTAAVAGCSLHLQPDDSVSMSMLGIFNEHGRTYAFDQRAKSGFARGEGVGCLILKPLDQAIKDNDKIRSVIVNSGAGQDGKTIGLSTPSGEAQEKLMRDVYKRAGVSFDDVGFVEAHGTGTKVGDPIEAGAIYRVFGSGRTKKSPLYMGSVKTNFGHLENASGIASVIKASLMLEKGFILPNVNFDTPNDAIPLKDWNIKVPTSLLPWPRGKRYISINNFGFGGSNAHVVLERPPLPETALPQTSHDAALNPPPKLFVFSGNDEQAARRVASNCGNYIEQRPDIFEIHLPRDLAYTLGERRTHLPWRIAVTAASCDELAKSLNGAAGVPRRANKVPRVAFAYTGQGAQWPRMGRELMKTHPVFEDTMKAASLCLQQLGADFDLLDEIFRDKESSNINKAHISQPATTAIQLGLTALFSSWGIHPSVTIGHSSGEIGAAYAAGALTMADAMAVAYYRGQVASGMRAKCPSLNGAMLAVGAGPSEVRKTIKLLGLQGVTVACENSPDSVTVSGDSKAINSLAAEFEKQSTFARKLRVDIAYHSTHMELVADDYLAAISTISGKPMSEHVSFFSSLLGRQAHGSQLGASYWVDNLTQPVLFSTALEELYNTAKPDIIVELGPHSALKGPITQTLKRISPMAASDVKYFPSLMRDSHATATCVDMAGGLFTQGCALNFGSINHPNACFRKPQVLTDLPPYPWSDHKYWFESRLSKNHRLKPFARHDLLGTLEDAYRDAEPVWRNHLTTDDVPWLKDHRMQGLVTFPLVGYLCMAVEAASQRAQLQGVTLQQAAGFRLREVHASKALILEDDASYEIVTSFRAYAEGTKSYSNEWDEFSISSWTTTRGWLEHCRGQISVRKQRAANPVCDRKDSGAQSRREHAASLDDHVSLEKFYAELRDRGAGYDSVFTLQPASGLRSEGNYSMATVVVPDTQSAMTSSHETPSILPTSFTDLFFQLTFPILGAGRGSMPTLFMPSAIRELEITNGVPNSPGGQVQVVAHGVPEPGRSAPVDFDMDAWDAAQDEPKVKIRGFRMTPVNGDGSEAEEPRKLCYKVEWQPLFEPREQASSGHNGEHASNGTNGQVPSNDDLAEPSHGHTNGHASAQGNGQATNGHADGRDNGHTNGQTTNGHTNGHANGQTNGHANGQTNGHANGQTNGHINTQVNGHATNGQVKVNGHNPVEVANGQHAPDKTGTNGHQASQNGDANGHSNGHGINGTAKVNGINHANGLVPSDTNSAQSHQDDDLVNAQVTIITDREASDGLIATLTSLIGLHAGIKPIVSRLQHVTAESSRRYVCLAELDTPVLLNMDQSTFQRVQDIILNCASVLWVSDGAYYLAEKPANNIAQGLLRTARSEAGKLAASLDLDPGSELDHVDRANLIVDALRCSLKTSDDGAPSNCEFAEEHGQLMVPRVVAQEDMNLALFRETRQTSAPYLQDFEQPGRRLQVVVGTPGALDSLYWQDEPETPLGGDEVEIKVAATGMNFKDVVIAMGQVPSPYLGVECSGTISRVGSNVTSLKEGDRVCAMSLGGYGTYTRCPATSAAIVPPEMDLDTAASVPVIYSTAYYGMMHLARMEAGQSVLIHAASGGVGQAAIQLAQMLGVEVYATVGSAEKKQLLMDRYTIPSGRIFYSRNTEFGSAIRAATGGRGVDVVINSLAGDLLRESWETLAPFGHFIEIGKKDILSNTRLDMAKFEYNCSFSSVDLTLVAAERPKIMGQVLSSVMNLLGQGVIQPVGPVTTVGISEVESALRKLQGGKTVGKVVVRHCLPGQQVKMTHSKASASVVKHDATYIIIGGTGGIGRSLAKKLAQQRAGHVVLLSRRGTITSELKLLIAEASSLGTAICVKACDVSDAASVNALIKEVSSVMPPIRGVVHAAMVLKDVLLEKMTFLDWTAVVQSKIQGSWNFHTALAGHDLDFFVMLSSVSGIIGNRGQAAYAAANTFLDSLAAYRRRRGLPAVSLNLSAVEDVGYLAENVTKKSDVMRNLSGTSMSEVELLALVQYAIEGKVDGFCDGQCITGLEFSDPASLPYYASDGRFSVLKQQALSLASTDAGSSSTAELTVSQKLSSIPDAEQAKDIVAAALLDKLGAVLMLPPEVMEAQKATTSITAFGLDSLTAIELRNWIGKELQTHLQVLEILTSGMLRDLAGLILRKTRLVGAWSQSEG